MASDGKNPQAGERLHRLELEQRTRLSVTGVTEVLRVEQTGVALGLEQNVLVVQGTGLRLRQLAPEDGRVELLGEVTALRYEQAAARRLLRRLLS